MNRISSLFSFIASKIGNVTMGTTATTITGAIAEHEGDISTINTMLNARSITAVGASLGEQTANSNGVVTGSYDISDSVPTGYTAILATPRGTGSYAFQFYSCWLTSSTTVYVQVIRRSGSVTTITPSVTLLCVKGF